MASAYDLGFAFARGFIAGLIRRGLQTDDIPDNLVIFRKAKNGKTIAINKNTGEVSGVCENLDEVEPSRPTFNDYLASKPELQGLPPYKQARAYLFDHYQNMKIKNPQGLKGCTELEFSGAGLRKTARDLNPDKLKVLPYLDYIYQTGYETNNKDNYKKSDSNLTFHYTEKNLKIDGEIYRVTMVSKQVGNRAQFTHYDLNKADK